MKQSGKVFPVCRLKRRYGLIERQTHLKNPRETAAGGSGEARRWSAGLVLSQGTRSSV